MKAIKCPFERIFLDNPLKTAIIPAAGKPFPSTKLLPVNNPRLQEDFTSLHRNASHFFSVKVLQYLDVGTYYLLNLEIYPADKSTSIFVIVWGSTLCQYLHVKPI